MYQNIDHLDQRKDDDQRPSYESLMRELESDAAYVAEMEARDAETLAGVQELDRLHRDADGTPVALPALQPVSARCNAVPATIWPDLANVWDKPVRSVAQRVA